VNWRFVRYTNPLLNFESSIIKVFVSKNFLLKEGLMSESIYKVIQLVGTSPVSWEEAAKNAIETAAKSLRDLRVAEIEKLDLKVEDGRVVAYRARVQLSFKYVDE
jgi:flavin-binding protein dodecin